VQLVVVSAAIAAVSMATSISTAFFLMIFHTFSRIPSKIPMIFLFFGAILVVTTPLLRGGGAGGGSGKRGKASPLTPLQKERGTPLLQGGGAGGGSDR